MNWLKALWKKLTAPMAYPPTMGEFTSRAQETLALARKEAERFNHNFVGTEHLLLGLITLGEGTAVAVLGKMGISLETVRGEVEKQMGTGPDQKMIGNIPYTPRVRKVLELAANEAKCLNHPCVGTGHILLGLLREGDGVAARVLKNLDVDIERTREEVLKELEPSRGSFPPATSQLSPIARKALRRSEPEQVSNFTPRAQQVLALARKEADRFNHNFVGTEHLLLGLIALGSGTAVIVLQTLGLDLQTVRLEVEKQVGTGPDRKMVGNVPYTPRVKKVLALAAKEARSLNHTYVGTEHLLLGMLREGDGIAPRILRNLNVDVEKTRQEILKELNPNSEPPATETVGAESQPLKQENPPVSDKSVFGCFTPHAQQALALSRKEADRLKHDSVGAEHLLLGIIKLGTGTAFTVLTKMGLKLDTVRMEIEIRLGTGPDHETIGNIPYTPRVKTVLALAAKEAKGLNHTYVGTEHILLGLLREGDNAAAQVLKSLDVYLEDTRQEILKELDPNLPAGPDPVSPKTMTMKSVYEPIDTSIRYDIFCREGNGKMIVYRNALFKKARSLFTQGDWDTLSNFLELEQSNGQTIFISRHSLVRFCPPGVKLEGEELPGGKDNPG